MESDPVKCPADGERLPVIVDGQADRPAVDDEVEPDDEAHVEIPDPHHLKRDVECQSGFEEER